MIAAGKLDRRIRLEEAGISTAPVTGENQKAWPPAAGFLVAEVWAERLPATGREMFTARQLVAEISAGWRIRWQASIATKVTPHEQFRIVDEAGRGYDIVEVREPEGTRRSELLIFGQARAE